MIVIHPNDKTTTFLNVLYKDLESCELYTEKNSNSKIKQAIINNNKIMMLGHGSNLGLFSRINDNYFYFDRLIINSKHVNFLRNKECIGIWCNANMFAEHYKLHGLFSGMIISELSEAYDWGIETTINEINKENVKFAERLRYCLDNFSLENVPQEMRKLNDNKSLLTQFNYNHLYFY